MKFLPLVWRNLLPAEGPHDLHAAVDLRRVPAVRLPDGDPRRRSRMGVDVAGVDRLMMIHKVSLIMPLPVSYLDADRSDAGRRRLVDAQHLVRRRLPGPDELRSRSIAVEPEPYLQLYPEFKRAARPDEGAGSPTARARSSARPGEALRLEDRRPHSDPGDDLAAEAGQTLGLQRRRHLRRRRQASTRRSSSSATTTSTRTGRAAQGQVGWYVVRIADPAQAADDRRRRSTRMFANSPAETKTTTEKALRRGLRQADRRHRRDHDRRSSRPCSFTILLVVGNTMAQAVRERTSELAVLKTLGFSNGLDPGARARRVAVHRGRSAAGSGSALAWLHRRSGGDPTNAHAAGVRPAERATSSLGRRAVRAARRRRRRAAGAWRRCACGSPTR